MRLDWYRRLMILMIPISLVLFICVLALHPGDVIYPDWFIDLISIPVFFGNQLSGSGYLGRSIDAALPKPIAGPAERTGTWIGCILGLAAGIGFAIIREAVPYAKSLSVVADILFTLGTVAAFAGLGNRVGQCIDKKSRPASERKIVGVAGLIGLVASIVIAATMAASLVSIVGVTSFLTAGAAVPLWVCGIAFVCSFTSAFASSADYVAKTTSYFRSSSTTDEKIKDRVQDRFHEYRGAAVGISTGLIVSGIILGALLISQPYLLAGAAGVIAGIMVVMTCVSVLGGLFSRIGRLIDSYKKKTKPAPIEEKQALLEENAQQQELMQTIEPEPSVRLDKKLERSKIPDDQVSAQAMLQNPKLTLLGGLNSVDSCPMDPDQDQEIPVNNHQTPSLRPISVEC